MAPNLNLFCCLQKRSKWIRAFLLLNFVVGFVLFYSREIDHHENFTQFRHYHWDLSHIGIKQYPFVENYEKKDWHDYEFIKYESTRQGPGEQGKGLKLTDPKEIELDKKLADEEGLHVMLSDRISVNRSIQDTRPSECKWKKYLKKLPQTSVIIVFYNEWLSILLRTLHSIYNRTPHELLKEIVIVDDNSSKPELKDELDAYLKANFDKRVKIVHLPKRHGLIVARMEGAKRASGEVLVFLDAHMEVVVNWLPPLLEPIVLSPTTVTTPTIDSLDRDSFEFRAMSGSRGIYDDLMWFQWFPLRRLDNISPVDPHQIPIMLGAAFAIRRDYFSDLGLYDEGLKIWNGEQMELSLKLHLCGGNLVECPCSRISHVFRTHHRNHELQGVDVVAANFKRVAEVWMGRFKEVMYRADPLRFGQADPGDLTKAKLIKQKLKCRPFDYFLDRVAPEMYTRYYYQADYPGYFAFGAIRSDKSPKFCVDFLDKYGRPVGLYECNNQNLTRPGWTQNFKLTYHKKLRVFERDDCLQENLHMDFCHYDGDHSHQNWKYDVDTKQLISEFGRKLCLSAQTDHIAESSLNASLATRPCDVNDLSQKWTWGTINETALRHFDQIRYEHQQFRGFDGL